MSLARRSGTVRQIEARLVYDCDVFSIELGLTPSIRHIPDLEGQDDAKVVYAYAVATLTDGAKQFEYMTRKELDAIRRRSKAGNNGPWVTDEGEMQRKLRDYFTAGVRLVWYVDHRARTARSYAAEDECVELTEQQSFDGGEVLPGLEVTLSELFAKISRTPETRQD